MTVRFDLSNPKKLDLNWLQVLAWNHAKVRNLEGQCWLRKMAWRKKKTNLWSCWPLNPAWAQNKFAPVECTHVHFSYSFGRVVCFAFWRALVRIDFQQTSRLIPPRTYCVIFALYFYSLMTPMYEFAQPSLDTRAQTCTHQWGDIKTRLEDHGIHNAAQMGIKAFAFLRKNARNINRHSVVNLAANLVVNLVQKMRIFPPQERGKSCGKRCGNFFRGKPVVNVLQCFVVKLLCGKSVVNLFPGNMQ